MQEDNTVTPTIAFIGAGRLGRCLAQALSTAGETVLAPLGRSDDTAAALAADLVFLTVPDDAIAPMARSLPWRRGQAVVHCSGATELGALEAAAAAGAVVGGFHPLQIFTADTQQSAALLAGSCVAIEAQLPLLGELQRLAGLLQMRPLTLPAGSRAAYHGAASFAASFLLSMLDEAAQVWAAAGLPQDLTLPALLPLARGTLAAAEARGLAGALAGPISRADTGVLAAHLRAFDALGGEHGNFYRQLSRRQLGLARTAGRLDEQQLQRLAQLIAAPPSQP